jgi:hypothetical protein
VSFERVARRRENSETSSQPGKRSVAVAARRRPRRPRRHLRHHHLLQLLLPLLLLLPAVVPPLARFRRVAAVFLAVLELERRAEQPIRPGDGAVVLEAVEEAGSLDSSWNQIPLLYRTFDSEYVYVYRC